MPCLAVTISVGILTSCITDSEQAVKKEIDRLQGRWKPVAVQDSGDNASPEEMEKIIVIVNGERLTFDFGDERQECTIKVDSTKSAKEIDLRDAKKQGKAMLGIYAVDGNNLKLYVDRDPNNPRPTQFKTKKGDDKLLYCLKRL